MCYICKHYIVVNSSEFLTTLLEYLNVQYTWKPTGLQPNVEELSGEVVI